MAEGMEADEVFPSRNKSIGKRKKKKKKPFFSWNVARMQIYIFNSHPPSNPPDSTAPKKKKESEKHGKQSGVSNTAGFVWFQYVTEAEKQVTLVPAT